MIVIDSSVVFKWFDETEAGSNQALQILRSHLDKSNIIVVPDLILYELANAWSTKSVLKLESIIDNIKMLKKYSLKTIHMDSSLLEKAVSVSKKYKVSVYDAIYAVLAKEKKCLLITADEKFTKKINLPFVKLLSEYQ